MIQLQLMALWLQDPLLPPDFLSKPTEMTKETTARGKLFIERDGQLEKYCPFSSCYAAHTWKMEGVTTAVCCEGITYTLIFCLRSDYTHS